MDIKLIIISILAQIAIIYFIFKLLKYIKKKNRSFEIDYVNGKENLFEKKYDKSIYNFNSVLTKISPENPFYLSSLVGLAETYSELQKNEEALKYIEKALNVVNKHKFPNLYKQQLEKLQEHIHSYEHLQNSQN